MDSIYNDGQVDLFHEPEKIGTGLNSVDDFFTARMALLQEGSDLLSNMDKAKAAVSQLNEEQLLSYASGLSTKAYNTTKDVVLDYFSTKAAKELDVVRRSSIEQQGAAQVTHLDEAAKADTITALAYAVPRLLDQFDRTSVAYDVAKRQYFTMLIQAQLEKSGMALNSVGDVALDVLGAMIPGRTVKQFTLNGMGPAEWYQHVQQFQSLTAEEQFKLLPQILATVAESSGGNTTMFMDRIMPYFTPEDAKGVLAFLAMDTLDLGLTLKGIPATLRLLKLARATRTPIKLLRDSGRASEAGKMVEAAAGDAKVAETLNTTQEDAAASMSPFQGEGFHPDITNQLAAESQKAVADRLALVDALTKPLHDENFFIRRSFYTPEQIAKMNAKWLKKFAGKATIKEQLDDGFVAEVAVDVPAENTPTLQSLTNTLRDLEAKQVELVQELQTVRATVGAQYNVWRSAEEVSSEAAHNLELIKDVETRIKNFVEVPATTAQTSEVRRVYYSYNEFGSMDATEFTNASSKINSPSMYVDQMVRGATDAATVRDFAGGKVRHQWLTAKRTALAGLDKKRRRALDSVLLQGDRDGVGFYTPDQLVTQGIRTPDGLIKFTTEEEVGAYYAMRRLFDELHSFKNTDLRRALGGEGYGAIKLQYGDEVVTQFLKPAADPGDIRRVFDARTNTIIDYIPQVGDDAPILYKTKYPIDHPSGEMLEYVLAKRSSLLDLPENVLRKRPGYVTKINPKIFWVADTVKTRLVNGIKQPHRQTVRFFDNLHDANTWAAARRAAGTKIEVTAGRDWLEMAPGRREEYEAQIFGGVYSGKRAEGEILFGLEGTEAERLGAFEAMEAYMNHVSSRMVAADFRMSLIRKFLDSSYDSFGQSYLTEAGNWRSPLKPTVPPKTREGLEAFRTWVTDQLRIPTTEERVWGTMMQRLAEVGAAVPAGTAGRRLLSKWPMQIGARDVFAQLRGLTFHATLGWFNPVQLVVQSFGAALAAAIDPVGWAKSVPKYMAMRAAMYASSDEAIAIIGRSAGLDTKYFTDMVRAYQKTGLHEATMTTADYLDLQGVAGGLQSLRWLADKGLVFFREGERYVRTTAFIQAYDKVRAAHKVTRLSSAQLEEAVNLSLTYTMNMNRANRAAWQKGVLSVPTQFMQIATKFIENVGSSLAGKPNARWTKAQTSRVILSQLALFGAAGFPAGGTLTKNLLSWMQSDDEFGLAIKDPKLLTAIEGGAIDWLLYDWSGEPLDLSTRVSLFANIQMIIDMAAQENRPLAQTMLGVSSTFLDRSAQAAVHIGRTIIPIMDDPSEFDPKLLAEAASEVAGIASSWSNFRKAQWWEAMRGVPDGRGGYIFGVDPEKNEPALWAQRLGLGNKTIRDYYNLRRSRLEHEKDIKQAVQMIIEIGDRHSANVSILTNSVSQEYMQAVIAAAVAGYTKDERRKIMEGVFAARSKEGFRLSEELEKALDIMIMKEDTTDYQLTPSLVKEQ